MELDKIKELIGGILSLDISEIEKLNEHTRLFSDLGMDSLDLFQLVVEAEAYFGISLNENAIPTIKTIGDAAELVRRMV